MTRPHHRTAALGSLALMASAVVTGLLTFGFWTLLARQHGAAAVGAASSEVSTIMFLGAAASLNMINVLARFLPVAGHRATRLIVTSYATAAAAAVVVALLFLLTPWADRAPDAAPAAPVFVLLVVLAGVFTIQDGALVGLGRSTWVPVENTAVGLLRIALLPLVALVPAVDGAGHQAVLAWGVALAAAVVVVNVVLLRRLAPAQRGEPALPDPRRLRRFVAIESVNTAVSSSISTFLPAIVTFLMGATIGGYFYVPWLVAATIQLLLMNVLISAVRESVANAASAARIMASQLRLGAVLVALVMLGCCVVPRLPLLLLGSDFADESAGLLRWIGLATPGAAVCLLYWAICLIEQRPWPMVALNLALAGGTVGAIALLQDALGLTGIGIVYAAVQTLIAIAVARPLWRMLRPLLRGDPAGAVDATHTADTPGRG